MIDWYKKVVFENYANFSGRARRSEFWFFRLMDFLIQLPLIILLVVFSLNDSAAMTIIMAIILVLYLLAMVIPTLAVLVRRLHDINKSGWYYFVSLIPFIGGIWLLILLFTEGDQGENDYGLDPKDDNNEIQEIGTNY